MAKLFKHKFQSAVADGADATLVRPSVWNGDAHDFKTGGRTVTAATDTIVTTDEWSLIKYNRTSAIAIALANPDANNFQAGWVAFVRNIGAGTISINNSNGINYGWGTTTAMALAQGEDAILISDGTNFDALCSSGSLWARAGQIPGTATNDNAAAGNVGEYLTVTGGSTALVTDTPTYTGAGFNLPVGDWDVEGSITFSGGAATPVNYFIASLYTTTGNLKNGLGSHWVPFWGLTPFSYVGNVVLPVNKWRIIIGSGTQLVCLNVQAGFTPGSINVVGTIRARRAR